MSYSTLFDHNSKTNKRRTGARIDAAAHGGTSIVWRIVERPTTHHEQSLAVQGIRPGMVEWVGPVATARHFPYVTAHVGQLEDASGTSEASNRLRSGPAEIR